MNAVAVLAAAVAVLGQNATILRAADAPDPRGPLRDAAGTVGGRHAGRGRPAAGGGRGVPGDALPPRRTVTVGAEAPIPAPIVAPILIVLGYAGPGAPTPAPYAAAGGRAVASAVKPGGAAGPYATAGLRTVRTVR